MKTAKYLNETWDSRHQARLCGLGAPRREMGL